MRYQAVAFDLDGTLLSSQSTILESSKKAIQKIREKGIKVFIVTGRHHTAVKPYYVELALDTPVVCCNGTYLYDFLQDRVIQQNPLTPEVTSFLVEQTQLLGIHTALYTRDAMVYEKINPHFEKLQNWVKSCPVSVRPNVYQVESFQKLIESNTTIWKVLISDPDLAKMQNFVDHLPLDCVSAEWSWRDRVDITMRGNSKGKCLEALLAQENIAPENVIAFGDNFNDISMLSLVGMGIAMGESDKAIQEVAKQVIGSNNENSIAITLNNLFNLNLSFE